MATYTKVYNNPYPNGWKAKPDLSTPYTTSIKDNECATFSHIEDYLYNNPIGDISSLSITDLSDVSSTSPTAGQTLVWDTTQSKYVPGTPASSISALSDVDGQTTPSTHDILIYDETNSKYSPRKLKWGDMDDVYYNPDESYISNGGLMAYVGYYGQWMNVDRYYSNIMPGFHYPQSYLVSEDQPLNPIGSIYCASNVYCDKVVLFKDPTDPQEEDIVFNTLTSISNDIYAPPVDVETGVSIDDEGVGDRTITIDGTMFITYGYYDGEQTETRNAGTYHNIAIPMGANVGNNEYFYAYFESVNLWEDDETDPEEPIYSSSKSGNIKYYSTDFSSIIPNDADWYGYSMALTITYALDSDPEPEESDDENEGE